jgi:hypothetical protein
MDFVRVNEQRRTANGGDRFRIVGSGFEGDREPAMEVAKARMNSMKDRRGCGINSAASRVMSRLPLTPREKRGGTQNKASPMRTINAHNQCELYSEDCEIMKGKMMKDWFNE